MTILRVKDATRDKLNVLKGVLGMKSVDAVIVSLMVSRKYTDAFFERIEELVPDE